MGSSPLARGLHKNKTDAALKARIIPARAGFTRRGDKAGGVRSDHPRSRGVYPSVERVPLHPAGSSPLARGLRHGRPVEGAQHRIIPARAGFTPRPTSRRSSAQDHPRSRGVYRQWCCWSFQCSGSSPLARGLPRARASWWRRTGIIPARAGFTRAPPPTLPQERDHPRSRGVYVLGDGGHCCDPGSSPLARGLPVGRRSAPGRRRIIPARAGFTTTRPSPVRPPTDHPRSRGVYVISTRKSPVSIGSSPLARGLQGGASCPGWRTGIIPARAGFTKRGRSSAARSTDHPRSRGVYYSRRHTFTATAGSSPLARGLPPASGRRRCRPRIIPARAGFTPQPHHRAPERRDHPRSRGVYSCVSNVCVAMVGSSPLARGLPGTCCSPKRSAGIIPARAGFTIFRDPLPIVLRDHPRSRGVYGGECITVTLVGGSSPLARGLHSRILGIPTTSHPTRPRLPSLPT